ncbi:MAG TPA: UDP-3-O-(3-hydroxymyristoyl)glucosamine N-acyltransferase [Casimicrobiaceae bacterium]|nr:UDP-3-O-(3-hydroxymyristoyl)glucosamine N-acyltransferase [Casimicrobiaceae bacterium]
MSQPLSELAQLVGAAVDGDGSVRVSHVATLESAGPGSIAFLARAKYRKQLATTGAAAVILAPAMAAETPLPKLVSKNPYATYAKVATILHPAQIAEPGCHPTALVDPGARVAPSASVGPRAIVGSGTIVGERARIGAGSIVGAGVAIGDDVLLHANVTIYDRTVIGPRTIVHSGAVIGADGFGMAEEAGRWIKIPQIGRVVIGADVEIGANTTIDRGAIEDTVIESDVKLDNLVQIGHNCQIGAHTAIAGCVGIAGSTRIGRNCLIGGAAMINGHIEICDGVVIDGAAMVRRSIGAPGEYAGLDPALPGKQWRRIVAIINHLPELEKRIHRLEAAAGTAPQDAAADRPEEAP